jgi:hypothetical protein
LEIKRVVAAAKQAEHDIADEHAEDTVVHERAEDIAAHEHAKDVVAHEPAKEVAALKKKTRGRLAQLGKLVAARRRQKSMSSTRSSRHTKMIF